MCHKHIVKRICRICQKIRLDPVSPRHSDIRTSSIYEILAFFSMNMNPIALSHVKNRNRHIPPPAGASADHCHAYCEPEQKPARSASPSRICRHLTAGSLSSPAADFFPGTPFFFFLLLALPQIIEQDNASQQDGIIDNQPARPRPSRHKPAAWKLPRSSAHTIIEKKHRPAHVQDHASRRFPDQADSRTDQPRSHRRRHDGNHQQIQEHRVGRHFKIKIQKRSQQNQIDSQACGKTCHHPVERTQSAGSHNPPSSLPSSHSDSLHLLFFLCQRCPQFSAAKRLVKHRSRRCDAQNRPVGKLKSRIRKIQRLPGAEKSRRQRQTGRQIIVSPCDLRSHPHQKHNQRPLAGCPCADHQAVENQRDPSCSARSTESGSCFPQQIVDTHSDKGHVKPGNGKQMADPVFLIHLFHLRIQTGFLSQKHRAHRASIIISQMPDKHTLPPAAQFMHKLPNQVIIR